MKCNVLIDKRRKTTFWRSFVVFDQDGPQLAMHEDRSFKLLMANKSRLILISDRFFSAFYPK